MPSHIKKVLFPLGLLASPLVILSGCGGGDGLSPTPTTTPEQTATPLPTGTTTPTVTPTSLTFANRINATFSNSTVAKVGAGLQSTDAQGDIETGYVGNTLRGFIVSFNQAGTNVRQISFGLSRKPGDNVKQGDVLQISNDFSPYTQTAALFFGDTMNKLSFTAKSGQLRLDTIRQIDRETYRLKFTIINALMVSDNTSGSKGQFTLNATATATIYTS